MKIERLIGILSILLQKEKVTAPYLAEKFEVSRRTINRDIEDLCKAGIPIVTVQGGNGGISIADGYKVDKTLLTQREMKGILAGLKGLDSISHNSNYKKLMDKLNLNSDSSLEEKVYDASGHIVIDLASHYKGLLAPKIEDIHNAIEENKLIEFEYYYSKGVSKRLMEPYLLVFQWTNWYVWGYCVLLDSIEKAGLTGHFDGKLFTENLKKLVYNSIERDTSKWSYYSVRPSNYINSPKSIFYKDNEDIVLKELNYLIETKPNGGIWDITWSWFENNDKYAKEFAISENWWKAEKAIHNLNLFRNFDRFDLTGKN